jgi:phospholipid-binding lipoprotein MlaA
MPAFNNFSRIFSTLAFTAMLGISLSGCAMNPRPMTQADDQAVSDPIAPVNRVMLGFNEFLDKVFFNPVDTAYRAVVPQVGRDAVHNVLENVKSPVYLANELLQGDLKGAGTVLKRFAINSTVGIAGILDVSDTPYQPEDLGQTLAVWGVGPGPYIVLPIVGPSTLRDAVGMAGDYYMDPLYGYARNTEKPGITYTRAALTLVDGKDRSRDLMDDLRRNSGDLYTSLQSVYMQRRNALINDLDPSRTELPKME